MLIELRKALISYQDYHMLLLIVAGDKIIKTALDAYGTVHAPSWAPGAGVWHRSQP